MLKMANLGLRFLLELCLLAAVGYWGFVAGNSLLAKVALGIGAPVLVAVVWGVFLSPKRLVALLATARLAMELVLFGLASVGLAATGHLALAAVLGIGYVINRILIGVWKQG